MSERPEPRENRIHPIPIPGASLLSRYDVPGTFADCYSTRVPGRISHAQFVEAFYTTRLLGLERSLLGVLAARPSTDAEARLLARGERSSFSAWQVEARAPDEIMLSAGRTRSWLSVAAPDDAARGGTELRFGSAVLPRAGGGLGVGFHALLGFHKLYSRALLSSARSRLCRRPPAA